jgi:hypothetical protein
VWCAPKRYNYGVTTLFVTFGDGARRYREASRRLGRQASESGWFDSVWAVTDISQFAEFHEAHRRILTNETRGFGYWVWKPFLLLEAVRAGFDQVVYADAGCVLNTTEGASRRLGELLALTEERPIVAMSTGYPELVHTKRATHEHFALTAEQLAAEQVGATLAIMRTRDAADLVAAWLAASISDDYRLLDDSPSDHPELPEFREHRWDQSIFSCLMKKGQIEPIDDESYFAGRWQIDGAGAPIWTARHRTGTPFPASGLRQRALFFIDRCLEHEARRRRAKTQLWRR